MVTALRSLATGQPYRAGDRSYSQLDAAKAADRAKAAAPVRAMTSALARQANAFVSSGGRDARSGACVLMMLETWAKAGALRDVTTHDAQFIRAVALSGWAMDFAQVRDIRLRGGAGDPRPIIVAWLTAQARDTCHHFENLRNATGRNNQRAWAGLAAMATAMATGDRELRRCGLTATHVALDEVTDQGFLPLEIARKERARHYHLYAVAPLVVTAEIVAANGGDLYGYKRGALRRLVHFTVHSIDYPGLVDRLSGAAQEPIHRSPGRLKGQYFAWLEFYVRRFGLATPGTEAVLSLRPLVNPEIGGDMTMLSRSNNGAH
ncbi:alginate lyase family protein [Sphingomonas sp. BK235]|uniref:alginate lyase family protein n=1 Tax=Sphingomonas sp. BK235 TaxID=2512131 RepID=UPI001404F2AB|nr:alginate lyase family protein [Sphingomonas sp. BK235]